MLEEKIILAIDEEELGSESTKEVDEDIEDDDAEKKNRAEGEELEDEEESDKPPVL